MSFVFFFCDLLEKGKVEHCKSIGLDLWYGHGVNTSRTHALKWWRLGSEHGNVECMVYLAKCYQAGVPTLIPISWEEAIRLYRYAVDAGSCEAMHRLGSMLSFKRQYAEGIKLLQKAVDLGHPDACVALGLAYKKLQEAVDRGHPYAYEEFPVSSTDLDHRQQRILSLYTLGMQRGSLLAMLMMIVRGNISENKHQKSVADLIRDAVEGSSIAATLLQLRYNWGIGVDVDNVKAHQWRQLRDKCRDYNDPLRDITLLHSADVRRVI